MYVGPDSSSSVKPKVLAGEVIYFIFDLTAFDNRPVQGVTSPVLAEDLWENILSKMSMHNRLIIKILILHELEVNANTEYIYF